MLTPRLTDCPECADIPNLLKKIDCKLAEYANGLYNNVVFMLNQIVPAGAMIQLLAYKRILTYKQCNPDYLSDFCMDKIVSKVIRLTLGCDIKYVHAPIPATSTTSTSSTSSSTSTSTTTTSSTTASLTTSTTSTSSTTTTTTTFNNVTIGTQIWTDKNLDVSIYANGDPIPEITDPTQWASLTTGAWCYYNNDPANGQIYGKLYNWHAVNDPRGLAPAGYHVPSDTEWTTLTTYLGGVNVAGGKMKEIGTAHWLSPNTDATDSSGFSGLPGGYRTSFGPFSLIDNYGYWWSSSANGASYSFFRNLRYDTGIAYRGSAEKLSGFSVRLIQD